MKKSRKSQAKSKPVSRLNYEYRNGGDMVEDRDCVGRDLVGDMGLSASRADVLANDLIRMGVIENGDDYPDNV